MFITFAVQYAVKTDKLTYNCITTMNFSTNVAITKFYLCLIIQKSSFCSHKFQRLHLSACVCIFSHFMTLYNFEANAIVIIFDIWLIVVILALWIENGEKLNCGQLHLPFNFSPFWIHSAKTTWVFYFSKWVWPMIRERPFNLKRGGYGFFLKKYSDSQCCWKKIFWLWWRKKIIWFRVFII